MRDNQTLELPSETPNDIRFEINRHISERDGAAILAEKIPKDFAPSQVSTPSIQQQAWELVGLHYFNQSRRRSFEALPIFLALYNHMLTAQDKTGERVHKGMPLLWIAECYATIGYMALRKRYLMLALCEDAVAGGGRISPEHSGVNFRLVWRLGLIDAALKRYAEDAYALAVEHPDKAMYPEWILLHMHRNWMTEVPDPAEANVYVANTYFVRLMLNGLGESTGKVLEELAEYVMLCMPGCRTVRRRKSHSTDYDLVCLMSGYAVDFGSELGRYFVCECKDWDKPANFSSIAKFCRVLDSVKSKFGILFSSEGISGAGKAKDADREQLKVYQHRGMVIVEVDRSDLGKVGDGESFATILRNKYEHVRLDLADAD